MQTRLNYREDPNNYGMCVTATNSQQEQILSSQPYSQKLFPSGQANQMNYDLHRRVFGQELSNYSTMAAVNTNSQSQKVIGMSQASQQNPAKKLSTQTDMEGVGMKYYEKINRNMQLQIQPQQYQKTFYNSKTTATTPIFFDNNGGAQIAQLGQHSQQMQQPQQQHQQEWPAKDLKQRKEQHHHGQQGNEIVGMVNPNKYSSVDTQLYKGDYTLDLNYQNNNNTANTTTTTNPIQTINNLNAKGQRLISDQDISNYSTTNSSNDNFEVQSLAIENAKTRNQKEIERQYNRILNEDKANPSKVAQYSREIFSYLKMKEKQLLINKNYMEEQPDISEHMRWILIDWLIEVHYKFKLLHETLFIAVYIIDKYLSIAKVKRGKLQTIGITALFIAAKYEEIYPPELHEFSEITDKACTKREILQMEGEIICALNFQITVPSSFRFAEWYTRLADFSAKDQCLVFYFIEVALLDTRFLKYSPSNIAASAVYMVNKLNKTDSCWPDLLEKDSGYNEQKLRPCAKDMIFIQQKLQKTQQKAVATKYSRPQFYKVGLILLYSKQDGNSILSKQKPQVNPNEHSYRTQPSSSTSPINNIHQQLLSYNSIKE